MLGARQRVSAITLYCERPCVQPVDNVSPYPVAAACNDTVTVTRLACAPHVDTSGAREPAAFVAQRMHAVC